MTRLIAPLVLALLSGCYVEYDWEKAEEDAKSFAANLPGSTGKVTCAKVDSDSDGYCSCTAFMQAGPPMQIDCGCPNKRADKGCMKEQALGCKPYNPLKGINLQGQGQ